MSNSTHYDEVDLSIYQIYQVQYLVARFYIDNTVRNTLFYTIFINILYKNSTSYQKTDKQ